MVLGVCGAGGGGREVMDLAEEINEIEHKWDKLVFVEKEGFEGNIKEYDVMTLETAIGSYLATDIEFVVSVGEPLLRKKIAEEIFDKEYHLAVLIAPDVRIPKSVVIGEGCIIRPRAYIAPDVVLGRNVLIQAGALIGHDVAIGNHTVISSLCSLSGGCTVGDRSYIALNCILKELTHIGNDTIVSMASVVRMDFGDNVLVNGNPAKVVAENYLKSVFGWNERKE